MKEYIEERAVAIANYIIDHNATVRQTAKKFGISKSTVHKDVTDRLEDINPSLAAQARIVLDVNKSERHIRGGLATREKYQHRLQICSRCWYFSLVARPPRIWRSDLFTSSTIRAWAARDGLMSSRRSVTSLCTVDLDIPNFLAVCLTVALWSMM